jgi:hypothetical protein
MLLSEIHKLINYILNKEELPDQWKQSIILPIHKNGVKTDYNNYRDITLLSTSYKILSNILFSNKVRIYKKLLGMICVGFDWGKIKLHCVNSYYNEC